MNFIGVFGATCSGKTDLSIEIAKYLLKLEFLKFKEKSYKNKITNKIKNYLINKIAIVNCDSRQVYKYLNIGTAKVDGKWQIDKLTQKKVYKYMKFNHYLIDYISLKNNFDLNSYIRDFFVLIKEFKKEKVKWVILVGGTGLYAKAILDNYPFIINSKKEEEKINQIKKKYQILNLKKLQNLVLKINSSQNKIFNNSDFCNKRRLINYIISSKIKVKQLYPNLKWDKKIAFYIDIEDNLLKKRIIRKVKERLKKGFIQEIKNIYSKVSFQKIESIGLDYRLGLYYLLGFLNYQEFVKQLITQNYRYAKRQKTWLKKSDWQKIKITEVKSIFKNTCFFD